MYFFKAKHGIILLIFSTLALLSYNYAGSFDDIEVKYEIVKYFEMDGKHVYVKKSLEGNKVFDEKQELVNGKLTAFEYHDLNILLWCLFIIFTIVVLGLLFDGEFPYLINKSMFNTYMHFLKIEKENGYYIYYYKNKHIKKSKTLLNEYDFMRSDFKNLNIRPDYEPKNKKRKRIFNEIGI